MALTPDDIRAAADTLLEELGTLEAVTNAGVRERLGRGSFGTIGTVLRSWKEEHRGRPPAAPVETPAVVFEKGSQALHGLWSACRDWIEVSVRDRVRALVADAQAQLAEAQGEVLRLEGVAQERADTLERLSLELVQAREDSARLERECATLVERTAAAERTAGEARAEAQEACLEAETARREAIGATAREDALRARVEELKGELEAVRAQERKALDSLAKRS